MASLLVSLPAQRLFGNGLNFAAIPSFSYQSEPRQYRIRDMVEDPLVQTQHQRYST